jgi:hypothetical protein
LQSRRDETLQHRLLMLSAKRENLSVRRSIFAAWQKRNAHVCCQALKTLAGLRNCGM